MRKIELVLHPVRFRILQLLTTANLTTQEIAERIPDTPKSSLYRHLKMLLEAEMIAVASTDLINGIVEKKYRLLKSPRLSAADTADVPADEHLNYFTTYVMSLLNDYSAYLSQADAEVGKIDMAADRVGYTDITLNLTDAEMDQLSQDLNATVIKYLAQAADDGRRARKISVIVHPRV